MPEPTLKAIAFDGARRIAYGDLLEVARATRAAIENGAASVLVFDAETSHPIELDFRLEAEDLERQVRNHSATPPAVGPPPAPRGPGRPKLGVVAREVTLLPRHWDWLSGQPGGASATIRRLIEDARRDDDGDHRRRQARENTYRFILALAGDLPGFEEATRGLFAGDRDRFAQHVGTWPPDVRAHALRLAEPSFA